MLVGRANDSICLATSGNYFPDTPSTPTIRSRTDNGISGTEIIRLGEIAIQTLPYFTTALCSRSIHLRCRAAIEPRRQSLRFMEFFYNADAIRRDRRLCLYSDKHP